MILQAPQSSKIQANPSLTLEAFLNLPSDGLTYELIDGQAIAKMSPKKFHARLTRVLLNLLEDWAGDKGEAFPELAVTLERNGKSWVPVPDLLFLSRDRFPPNWEEDGPCSIPPDLAIEIISPGQTFGEMAKKAEDYLAAGVKRVWVVDAKARSITVFYPNAAPQTLTGEAIFTDENLSLSGLSFTVEQIFQQAKIQESAD